MRLRLWVAAMLVLAKVCNVQAEESNSSAVIEDLFAAPVPVDTNTLSKGSPGLKVLTYHIEGNTVLPPGDFGILSNYTGTNIHFVDLRAGLGKLQLRYRELGFPTISVTLPQQKLTNGVVHVKVIEGKISDIIIKGNRYYSTNNIHRALPGLTTNILLNTKWFQPELDRANLNQDRQIYPVIAPGFEPGTTELTLKVKDQLPLHGHMELNDYSTPNTPLLRLDTALQYDNLWQLNHQVGVDYNFSPQELKTGSHDFYDQPMVDNYSAYYRLPLGTGQSLRKDYENLPVTFGYDEVTHRFNLPPATGNPDLIFYASRAVSDTPVISGPVTVITNTALADISTQSKQRAPTFNDNFGTKLTIPLREFLRVNSSLQLGIDFKSYEAQNFTTNLTYFNLYGLDSFGNRVLETNYTIPLANNSVNKLFYLPLSLGWSGTRPDETGSSSLNLNQSIFLQPLASSHTDFQTVAGSPHAGGNYTTINAAFMRLQDLPAGWSLLFNANGQWASAPLISNEQFGLGGLSGVRGYQTGENYGDTGWRTQLDLRAPPINVGYFPTSAGEVPANLRCSVFMDYGRVNLFDRPDVSGGRLSQWGTGAGFLLTVGENFTARLTVAWALAETAAGDALNASAGPVQTPQGAMRAYFSIGYQF